MSAKLVAEQGDLKGLILSLEDGNQWIIGRDPDLCQFVVEDPTASREHLLCRQTPDGITVENLSLTNPVKINDEEVKEPRLLQDGDTVKIGNGEFRFYADSNAQINDETTSLSEKKLNGKQSELQLINGKQREKEAEKSMERQDTIFEEEDLNSGSSVNLAEINFDLSETGRWLLKVIGGPNNGAEFSMHASKTYIIGTDPNTCDIVFHDTSVSRQHVRLSIDDNDSLFIEDLKSRNGTLVDGNAIQNKQPVNTNTVITIGTTSFVVYDREGEMQTIISPLLPSIVKVLQQEEPKKEDENKNTTPIKEEAPIAELPLPIPKVKKIASLSALILIGVLTSLFVIVGIGTVTLFKGEPVTINAVINEDVVLKQALSSFPDLKYSYNKNTGRLLLIGHVMTASDKSQLLYNLQGLNFVKYIDDSSVVIDEFVSQEINQIISSNPSWKGIAIHATSPGQFAMTGYLPTRKDAIQLSDYVSINFHDTENLENRVVVAEDVINQINTYLQDKGIQDVTVKMSNGEINLSGAVATTKSKDLTDVVNQIRNIPGVRTINNYVTTSSAEQGIINLTEQYRISGISNLGGKLSVVINGRVLSQNDSLDGMTITSIRPNTVFLERAGVTYRIDFNQ